MPNYKAPVQDVLHSLVDLHGFIEHYRQVAPHAALDAGTLTSVLEQMGRFAERELSPLNAPGDSAGARYSEGLVTTPAGFAAAYDRYREAGWPGLAQPTEFGGQGLPYSLWLAASEFLQAANHAWCMYSMLNDGAIKTLMRFADRAQQDLFVPKLVDGTWTATMCLTESNAGSDLGLLRTRAEPMGDGSYRLTGNKIFISSGEHDLAPNIVHLVLARLPDAPPGVRGISLFVVPKRKLRADGSAGELNGVSCLSIEHKLGIKGAATCSMVFDSAEGWLVGDAHRGLACMFVFINKSRLAVSLQAVAHAQAAFADSLTYACERLQGRAPTGPARPSQPADPLIVHPDVRRMLLTQKAIAEGGRALLHYCGRWVDLADGADDAQREPAERMLALLTPIAKAFLSELAFESVDLALQVFGGHGYVKDWGMEQRLRDVRITRIYEGTTGIQALDLLGRKVLADPDILLGFSGEINAWCDRCANQPLLASLAERLRAALDSWLKVSGDLVSRVASDADLVGAIGVDYLMVSGFVALGYMWARTAEVSSRVAGAGPFHDGKVQTAVFYFDKLLPRIYAHIAAIDAGSTAIMGIEDRAFAA